MATGKGSHLGSFAAGFVQAYLAARRLAMQQAYFESMSKLRQQQFEFEKARFGYDPKTNMFWDPKSGGYTSHTPIGNVNTGAADAYSGGFGASPGPGTPARAGDGGGVAGNAAEMRDFYVKQGYTPQGAAAIVGNWQQENSLKGGGWGGDKGTSAGGFQWHNERGTAFMNWAKDNKLDVNDPMTSARYSIVDLQNNFPDLDKYLRSTNNVDEATQQFEKTFEVAGDPQMGNRLDAARAVYGQKSGKPKAEDIATKDATPQSGMVRTKNGEFVIPPGGRPEQDQRELQIDPASVGAGGRPPPGAAIPWGAGAGPGSGAAQPPPGYVPPYANYPASTSYPPAQPGRPAVPGGPAYPPANPNTATDRGPAYPPANPNTATDRGPAYPPANPNTATDRGPAYPPPNVYPPPEARPSTVPPSTMGGAAANVPAPNAQTVSSPRGPATPTQAIPPRAGMQITTFDRPNMDAISGPYHTGRGPSGGPPQMGMLDLSNMFNRNKPAAPTQQPVATQSPTQAPPVAANTPASVQPRPVNTVALTGGNQPTPGRLQSVDAPMPPSRPPMVSAMNSAIPTHPGMDDTTQDDMLAMNVGNSDLGARKGGAVRRPNGYVRGGKVVQTGRRY